MRAGQLRYRVIIENKIKTRDTDGGEVVSWSTNIPVWASIQPLRGQEYFNAQQTKAIVSHRIRIRYTQLAASTEITPGECRINWDSRYFNIHSVINASERNIYLDLMCSEGV